MDKFVKRENEMWKMPAAECIQTRIVAVKRVLDFWHRLSVCPATHSEDVLAKSNTHTTAIILNYRNVAKLEIDRYIGVPIFKHFTIIGYRFKNKTKKNPFFHIHNYTEYN